MAQNFPYHLNKAVIAVAPHTSNRDFILGLGVRSVLGLDDIRFLGKKELFAPPFGFLFRRLGGTPVDRKSKHNMVEQVIARFQENEKFLLAISPEGTRSRVDRLRTGFYHIAKGAGVPIIMVAFDFGNRRVFFAEPFYPTQNETADLKHMLNFFGPVAGKIPENGLAQLMAKANAAASSAE